MSKTVEVARSAQHIIVVGVGDSPGEITHADLFRRKLNEQKEHGRAFWYTGSRGFSPKSLSSISIPESICVLFVKLGKPSGREGRVVANYRDVNSGEWHPITGDVTGDPAAKYPKIIAFHQLEICGVEQEIDLGQYSTYPGGKRVLHGNAGPCWATKTSPFKEGPSKRKLLGVAQLIYPFAAVARFQNPAQ